MRRLIVHCTLALAPALCTLAAAQDPREPGTYSGLPAATPSASGMPVNPLNPQLQTGSAPLQLPGSVPPQAGRSRPAGLVPASAEPAAVGAGAQAQNTRADLGPVPPLEETLFQQFVRESTGKALPLFGYTLFDRSRYPSRTDLPVPATYVLGPGDEIDLKIWGAVDVASRLPVDRNGQITIPKVGPVTVVGVSASELDAHLKKQVGRVFNNFELAASVGKLRSVQIYVVGHARNPGAYTVSSLSNLIGAIFESGGPATTGSMRNIQLVRAGRSVTSVDLYRFIQEGSTSVAGSQGAAGDARLQPDDVIVIPPAGPRVAIVGALDTPAVFELGPNPEPLGQVLGYSGFSSTLVKPGKVLVERVDRQNERAPREVQEFSLNADSLRNPVRGGDLITLLPVGSQFSNAVTLRGNVAIPLRHAPRPGMRVSDLIPDADLLISPDYHTRKNALVQRDAEREVTETRLIATCAACSREINWDYASIERIDRKELRTRLIPFNLAKAVKDRDPAHNLTLEPGDIVTVFGVDDIDVPREKRSRYVKLMGEVKVPGIYAVGPSDTLPALVARAGGLASDAYLYGTVFTRESTRAQQQANLDQAVRRLENQLSAQASALLQNTTNAESNQAIQAQLAGQRMSLDRLKTLKASGRISLEMEPESAQLPPITLEDGDVITIPARSGFVAVFGAVLAETSFIHRPGATLRDYLERAGLTRSADEDSVMVIRTDGSVVSALGKTSRWFSLNASIMDRKVYPGDSVFVPEVLDKRTGYARFIEGAKDWSQLLYQFGLSAAAIKTLRQ